MPVSTSSKKKLSPEREVEAPGPSLRSVSGAAEFLTVEERRLAGRTVREAFPRSIHAEFTPDASRPDPIGLLEEQGKTGSRISFRFAMAGCSRLHLRSSEVRRR